MKEQINPDKIPVHVAIIMDGNGRWAKKQGEFRTFGHFSAVQSVREAAEGAAEIGIKYLTLFAFSTENWMRPSEEVTALMELLVSTITEELPTLNKNSIKLNTIGDISKMPSNCQLKLKEAMQETAKNDHMTLTLALNYSGRWDILQATQNLAREVADGKLKAEDIDIDTYKNFLSTKDIPDPELLIRTSGEFRISNFLLWQLAYSEIYITDTLWPDFRKNHLHQALMDYQRRERRFGLTSEQINS